MIFFLAVNVQNKMVAAKKIVARIMGLRFLVKALYILFSLSKSLLRSVDHFSVALDASKHGFHSRIPGLTQFCSFLILTAPFGILAYGCDIRSLMTKTSCDNKKTVFHNV